ncbi:hypothetical protein [Microvirga solisilvae]|uniref:hypothetical protein n=1 Tax=Microvirga solisilvae TaxID=2919498 RepID=UPI001FAEAE02|nr:hypothetical protein [Microvirga solisilvae]
MSELESDLEKQIEAAKRDIIRCERHLSKAQDEVRWAEDEVLNAKARHRRLLKKMAKQLMEPSHD